MDEQQKALELLFQIKSGSDLAKVLELMVANPAGVTREEIDGLFPDRPGRGRWHLSRVDDFFSNAVVRRHKRKYILNYRVPAKIDVNEFSIAAAPSSIAQPHLTAPKQESVLFPPNAQVPKPVANFIKLPFYDSMRTMVQLNRHISLSGPPSVGKSSSVEQLAFEMNRPLINVNGDAGLRRRDLTGSDRIVQGTSIFEVAEYASAAIKGYWAKIDEINAADPDAVLFLNGQLAPPYVVNFHGREYPVHPDFRLFVTYNPGLAGTKPLPPAFKDRFFPVKVDFPSEALLKRLLKANGMDDTIQESNVVQLLTFAKQIWEAHSNGQLRYQITLRRLIDAVALMKQGYYIKQAIEAAVIATIDSPVEAKIVYGLLPA